MKKKIIKKKTKNIISILVGVLLAGSAIGLFWSYTSPLEVPEEVEVFSYKQEGAVEYQVYYRPNQFVPEAPQAATKAYITDITDYIDTVFSYNFVGQREASIEGEYSVVASVSAYTGRERIIVWDKTYSLLEPTSFSVKDKNLILQQKVRVPFTQYTALAEKIAEGIRFVPDDLELVIKYNVALKAETDSGIIREQIGPMIVIPLKGSVYTVSGNLTDSKEAGLKGTQMVRQPLAGEKRLGFSIATGLFILLQLAVLLFTKGQEEDSLLEKTIRKIIKKHGDRIVICKSGMKTQVFSDESFEVKSFEDLLKVADELGKPILYNGQQKDDGPFFIVLADNTYIYQVKAYIGPRNKSKEKALFI